MPLSSQFPLTPTASTFSLPDFVRTKVSEYAIRIARSFGTCMPSLKRWADNQQQTHRKRVECLNIQEHYGETVYDQINKEFAHKIGMPLTQRKLQQIANRAEFLAIEKSVKNSLTSHAYEKANSIVDAQAPALSQEIINASKNARLKPELLAKAERNDEDAQQLLNVLSESVIRERIQTKNAGTTDQELMIEATLILGRLNNPAGWEINRFQKLNKLIQDKNSTAVEVLTALRELSSAFELKHYVKGKRFDAPQDRLNFLIRRFNEFFKSQPEEPNKPNYQNLLKAFMEHPVVIQCWQLASSDYFLVEVQGHIEDQLTKKAGEIAASSAGRDRILIESLLTVMAEHAEGKVNISEWMENTSIPDTVYKNGQSAADFVQADFWKAMHMQVAKETNITIESLRTATATETESFRY